MAITASAISALIARYKNDIIVKQANLECPFKKSGALKTVKKKNQVGVVNIKAGGLTSTTAIADGGTLPSGASKDLAQGTYLPVAFVSRLSIPRLAASLAEKTSDGIALVFEQMETCGEDLGRFLGRSIFGADVYTFVSTDDFDASSDSTFTVADPSGFRVGNNYEVRDATASWALLHTVTVTKVDIPSGGGAATITLDTTYANTIAAGDKIYLAGTYSNGMTSLNDVSAAAALYGQAITANEWHGNLKSSAGSYSTSMHKDMFTLIARRRGKKPSHTVVNSFGEQLIAEAHTPQRRYAAGKMDEFGLELQFDGRPVLVDENCGDTDIYCHQTSDVKLHEFRDFAPDIDGRKSAGMNNSAVLIDDTNFVYDVQVWGAYNLRAERRNGSGRIAGVTA